MTHYVNIDFDSFKNKSIEVLQESDTFRDYNFQGSNITILLELMSYIVEYNTYYQNKIIDNMFLDTAKLYNTVHRLAGLVGYKPVGHVSAYTNITINVSNLSVSNSDRTLTIPEYSIFKTEDELEFVNTMEYNITLPAGNNSIEFEISVKEGQHERLYYTGRDLVDYSIILPSVAYDNDNNIDNEHQSIKLYVNPEQNQEPWIRINDVFQDISGLDEENNVYSFEYNKYRNYVVYFSGARNYPEDNDDVVIDLIRSSGSDGSVGSNTIIESDGEFLFDNGTPIDLDNITITNQYPTIASSDPETIEQIKQNATSNFNMQYRCVTRSDFNNYIETRDDVIKANVWGEQEQAESLGLSGSDVQLYNQIYISVIPSVWNENTITQTDVNWTLNTGDTITVQKSDNFTENFKSDISKFLEVRKLLNTFENFILPDLIYFSFDIGITIRRGYSYNNVVQSIRNKLLYLFDPSNREFNDVIDFRLLTDNLKNTNIVSSADPFRYIFGIRTLVIRDINIINTSTESEIIENYESLNYPQYTLDNMSQYDNVLRPIKLGLNQFPVVTENSIIINQEG